jgi:hypothetical protein
MPPLLLAVALHHRRQAAVGGSLAMSRTYDLRGKLIQTTQNISGRFITTSYYYDPGNT